DLDQHLYLHELGADERQLIGRPDTYIALSKKAASSPRAANTAVATPIYTRTKVLAIDEEGYLRILDRHSRKLITVIEILSPANKGSDRPDYLAKRQKYLSAGVGLVE